MTVTYDTSKLRGRIVEKYGSQRAFSRVANKSNAFISNVMNGKSCLSQNDIDEWSDLLDIVSQDIGIYFFSHQVHETEREVI